MSISPPGTTTAQAEEAPTPTAAEAAKANGHHDNHDSSSSSSSSSSSKNTSKNHHVSFPVDQCSKNTSVAGFVLKKSHSLFNSSQSSREKIVYSRPPDGGWGWVVVFASFMINLIADGISLSFGVLFVELLETFGESQAKTSWVGSLFLSIPLLTGPIASALTDHFGCRKTAIAGSILSAIGFVLGYFSSQIEHLFVAFSIAGFGIALCTVTSIVAVAYYFERRRSLATGLSVSGSGLGTSIFPPFTIYVLEKCGWRKTLLVLAGVFLTIIFFGMLIRDIDIDEFESDDEEEGESNDDDDSSSEDDSGSDIDSAELDSIPEVDEEEELDNSRMNSSRRSSNGSAKFNRKAVFSRSSRARHISECEKSHEALPRACASLINIPTYIKESSYRKGHKTSANGAENGKTSNGECSDTKADTGSANSQADENGNSASELTFRRGGYLHNLIRYYPHLLSLFLQPCNVECNDDLTVKTVPSKPLENATDDAKMRCLEEVFQTNNTGNQTLAVGNGRQSPLITNDAFCPSVLNESVSIIVPSTRPSKNELLNYHKNRHHRLNRLARNRHRHRMHQTHLHHDLSGGNCLNNLRLQRGSLTYRSAMLVISKYKLKASSCPDIYRTSMATINDNKRLTFFQNLKELFSEMIDFSSLKNIAFLIFCISNFILYACIDIPYVYLPAQALSTGSFDKEGASLLISIIGIFNTPGIILTGYIGDKPYLDASMIYAIFTLVSGMALTAIPLSTDRMIVSALTAVYGFAISANYSLVSVILVELISLDSFTQAYGLLLLLQGIASLLGPPIVGWIYDVTSAYDVAFYLTGICVVLSGIMVIPIGKKQNCFLWSRRTSRSGSTSSLAFRPLNFIKKVNSNNCKAAKIPKSPTEKNGDCSKVPATLLSGKNDCITDVDK